MKYLEEFRDPDLAQRLLDDIRRTVTKPWAIMEVCGGQTHSIIRNGIDQLLPAEVELIHGPGCPVCVTPLEIIDKALAIAAQPGVIFCSFGDSCAPGSDKDPSASRAKAATCVSSIAARRAQLARKSRPAGVFSASALKPPRRLTPWP